MPPVELHLRADFLSACPKPIRDDSTCHARCKNPTVAGVPMDLIEIKASAAVQNINKYNHNPNIGGPKSFVVLMFSVTWRGNGHVNDATSMSGRVVASGRYREALLRAGGRR